MRCTSAEANKLLKQLMDERDRLIRNESQTSRFVAATTEDIENVRPEYNFMEMQDKIREVEQKIRKVKHAINVFNTTHYVDGFGITIDEMLVYMPQLTARKSVLSAMCGKLPKERVAHYGNKPNFIKYEYANYDISAVEKSYKQVSEMIARAQIELDKANSTETMDIDI